MGAGIQVEITKRAKVCSVPPYICLFGINKLHIYVLLLITSEWFSKIVKSVAPDKLGRLLVVFNL